MEGIFLGKANNNSSIIHVNISAQNKMQTLEGWGTTLCWWTNIIGNWQNEDKINEIADLLFSNEKGLGINILRYNIGAGENPCNIRNLRVGANMPCYLSEQGEWNWEADAGQRKMLFKAKDRDANLFEAFSNAPPSFMTKNGSTSGAKDRRNNLKDDKYNEFAEFLTEVVKHFRDELGITFNTLTPFNEPIACWWHDGNNQEGCFFDTDKQIEILQKVIKSLKSKGLKETSVTGPEGWSVYDSVYSYGCYNDEIKAHMSQICTHGYSGDNNSRTFLKEIAKKEGKRLWMTEVSCGGTEPHNHNDMSSALELAKMMRDYLVEMNASAWVYWQAVENEQLNHNHGLIHANFTGTEDYWITKQYYAFANFSKYIKPGTVILDTDDEHIVAAYDKNNGNLVLVFINYEDAEKEYICNLSGFSRLGSSAELYRTSDKENFAMIKKESICDNKLNIDLIGKSISTYLISSVKL